MTDLGFIDPLAAGDFRLDEARDNPPCPSCHAPEPIRFGTVDGRTVCNRCHDGWPRCGICRRWTGDASGLAPVEGRATFEGRLVDVCLYCFEKADGGYADVVAEGRAVA